MIDKEEIVDILEEYFDINGESPRKEISVLEIGALAHYIYNRIEENQK